MLIIVVPARSEFGKYPTPVKRMKVTPLSCEDAAVEQSPVKRVRE